MEKFLITGGNKLKGTVKVGGAKNAALAVMSASVLSNEVCRIKNIPGISDVSLVAKILAEINVKVKMLNKTTIEIDPTRVVQRPVSCDIVRRVRASYYLLGALLGRFSKASVSLPGGCNFGVRPIDQHLKGFARLGANYEIDAGMINVESEKLSGNNVYFDVVSVGATINIILASVKAEGLTVLENAAKEPHVVDLANFLNSMGADIRGAGTDVIKIRGVEYLSGTSYSIIPDQIEAGTYMVAAAATGGDVMVQNVTPKHLEAIKSKLEEMGVTIEEHEESVRVTQDGPLEKCNVKTMPHPGFPTDMQPQISALLSLAQGTSIVNEGVWDNRFRYIEELKRMGANISVDGKIAVIEGVKRLTGTYTKATDLRAGAALVIAGLAASGETTIENIDHIERGYENICQKLLNLGANIKRINEENEPINMAKVL
ncbi:MAG: UDP-N-acetylglucosamine 1-carboxyvinyltransferase [Oscillospiraceae bacterium]|nr:UDP-N-acetylglucosamine 1-carboxyvinyltransferase [Oscillospiraceae bacterium]